MSRPASYTVYVEESVIYTLEVHAKNRDELITEVKERLDDLDIDNSVDGGRKIIKIDVNEVFCQSKPDIDQDTYLDLYPQLLK